ncbi:MAG TPA: choice-of-anchor tandem repeat GloVer-containing protein [Verrucomicrobiae bacterium]|jgi:uncharacterized repeat protein (TIGR03803 family)
MKCRYLFGLFFAVLVALGNSLPIQAQSNDFRVLYTFTLNTNTAYFDSGASPTGNLLLLGNTLYGTTASGGAFGAGVIYSINTDGSGFTNLFNFGSAGVGGGPNGGLICLGEKLFGTTSDGSVFSISTNGSDFANLTYSSGNMTCGLVSSGNTLYGVGATDSTNWPGNSVFAVDTDGFGFTNIFDFNSSTGDTRQSLAVSGNTLYGTAGFTNEPGMVFAMNTDGSSFTNLHNFTADEGYESLAPLILSGNTLYGTTIGGGAQLNGTVFAINADGSGFTNLHDFNGTDGSMPQASLFLSGDTLYGTTFFGGNVFSLNTNGSNFMSLYSFKGKFGYGAPSGVVVSGNTLYGTVPEGISTANGTTNGIIFALTVPGLPRMAISPPLGIIDLNEKTVVSWPAQATNFALQFTTDLSAGKWTVITNGIAVAGTNFVFTNVLNDSTAYFRLKEQ